MLRPTLITGAVALLCTGAMAQLVDKSHLRPIAAPIKNAGVFHVATGTWTRGGSIANVTGPSTIFNNTCGQVYFTGLQSGELFQHRGRIPSPTGPRTNSLFYGSTNANHRYDTKEGCATSYLVNAFTVAYCSDHAGPMDWIYSFADSYTACGGADMPVAPAANTFLVTGLPGQNAGNAACWNVSIDVSGSSIGGFILSADGNGTYDAAGTGDQFGWSFGISGTGPLVTTAEATGPVIAGDFTWTGGAGTLYTQNYPGGIPPCTGTDGTIWDNPINLAEEGTGMDRFDGWRDTGTVTSSSAGPACYWFGGGPIPGDFYLKVFSSQASCKDPVTVFCVGGVSGVIACPCNNPPATPDRGCNNNQVPQVGAVAATGGAKLGGSGVASIAADTLSLNISATLKQIHVLFVGTKNTANVRTGAGIRCVTSGLNPSGQNFLKRIMKQTPTNGPPSTMALINIRANSIAKAAPPNAGETYYYYAAYRNSAMNGATGTPGCPGITFGFNATNAGAVTWQP